jgi:hypothetical protein
MKKKKKKKLKKLKPLFLVHAFSLQPPLSWNRPYT